MTVFDASALLACLTGEPGAQAVEVALRRGGRCGAASWSETAQKVRQGGADWAVASQLLLSLGVVVEPATRADGEAAAALWRKGSGLSLGDRLCLALGQRVEEELVTTDTAWDGLPNVVLAR